MKVFMSRNKKAVYQWISWVLLVAFIIALSALMYDWITDYTKTSVEDVKRVVYNTEQCDYVGISIDNTCQNATDLNIYLNITNRYNLNIEQLITRLYYNETPINSTEINLTLRPERTKTITIENQTNADLIEIIPALYKEHKKII